MHNKHMPLVLEYLRTHTFAQLEAEHNVCARPNARLDKLSLNYSKEAKSGNKLTEQCRGMVIRPAGWSSRSVPLDRTMGDMVRKDASWRHEVLSAGAELLAWPMSRFYNDGDPAAAELDWAQARVLEKLDGTMCVLYWDPLHAQWHVATRSVPEADLPVRAGDLLIGSMTFAGLFWRSLSATISDSRACPSSSMVGEVFSHALEKRTTYVFELTGPHNKVVVDYAQERVTLLAARNIDTGHEHDLRSLPHPFGTWVPLVQEWSLSNPCVLKEHVKARAGNECEGAVVVSHGAGPEPARRKYKNDRWLMAARFKDTIDTSRRGALRMVIDGTWTPEAAEISPDVMQQFVHLSEKLQAYLARVDANFAVWSARAPKMPGENMRKSFALLVQACPLTERSPAYFQLWDGKATSAAHWLQCLSDAKKLSDGTLDDILEKIDMLANGAVSQVF